MKIYTLSYLLEKEVNYKIRKLVGEFGRVFEGQGIKVSWIKPENYTVELMNFGYSFPFFKRISYIKKLDNIVIKPIPVELNRCEIGLHRRYKDLVYISIGNGGEMLRDLIFNIRKELGIDDFSNYIPKIALGRITKDLSVQEYTNLKMDLQKLSEKLKIEEISFILKDFTLFQFEEDQLKSLRNFEIKASASS